MPKKKLTAEAAAKEWIELKVSEQAIEDRRRELRAVLEPALEAAPDRLLEFDGWKFMLVEFVKESFSLLKAKEKIDGRTLAPFITSTTVRSIRPVWKGGSDKGNA